MSGRGKTVQRIATADSHDTIQFAVTIRLLPRAVVVLEFDRPQPGGAADCVRRRRDRTGKALAAASDADDGLGQGVRVVDAGAACGREIAAIGPVRALGELHAAHELGNQKAQIGVAVTMSMRRHVHRHPCHDGGEIGAVIQVEPAQVVLVRFALPAVLADDDARHCLQYFSGSERSAGHGAVGL